MKFIDNTIQDALLAGQKVYHEDTCYFLSISGTLMQENAKGRIPAMLSKEDLSATDWSPFQPTYDYDKIITDKILCRFWNDSDAFSNYLYGKLGNAKDGRFNIKHTAIWLDNCEPVGISDINITTNPACYRR